MHMPHRNDATPPVARCPNQDHASSGQISGSEESLLSVALAFVQHGRGAASEHQTRIGEIQSRCFRVAARLSGSKLMIT